MDHHVTYVADCGGVHTGGRESTFLEKYEGFMRPRVLLRVSNSDLLIFLKLS